MRKVEPLKNIYDVYDLGRVGEGVGEFLHEYAARRESHNGQLLYVELNEIEAEPRWAEHKAAIDLLRENCGNTFRLYFWW